MGIGKLFGGCFAARGVADEDSNNSTNRTSYLRVEARGDARGKSASGVRVTCNTIHPSDPTKPAETTTTDGELDKALSLPPLPSGKSKLSKRKLAKLQAAEELAAEQARAEDEETMSQYLGKSASCSSLNSLPSLPRVLSNSSLSRCATPERRAKDAMLQFDDEGHVLVALGTHNRMASLGSETSWPVSTPSSAMGTPDLSDCRLLGLPMAGRLEMSDLTSMTHSASATDFGGVSIDADGIETMKYIPMAVRSVSNPRFAETMAESVFKPYADKWVGAGTVLVGGEERDREKREVMRRNVSWSHFNEISVGMRRASSEHDLHRRHTVLVLTNDIDEEGDDGAAAGAAAAGKPISKKVSQVFESHHVHLSKLQEQMGDASRAPEDLLQLMSRKLFDSRSDLASMSSANHDDDDDNDNENENENENGREGVLSDGTSTLSSHDLSDCSDRLPKIRTRW